MVLFLTGLYSLVTGRKSWAHIAVRRVGAIVAGASLVGLIASSAVLGATAPASNTPPTMTVAGTPVPLKPYTAATHSSKATPTTVSPTPALTSAPKSTPPPPSFAGAKVSGSFVVNAVGIVLPDKTTTPGATNPAVNQGNIAQTICVNGWAATVRPESTLTTALEGLQLGAGYVHRGDTNPADYEEDHIIPLELGGAPADSRNLWPEPNNSPDGAKVKDVLENKLHDLVCTGSLSLVVAQKAVASDWWTADQTYVAPAPAPAPAPHPHQLQYQAVVRLHYAMTAPIPTPRTIRALALITKGWRSGTSNN